jgi:hypothetical protein
LRQACLSGPSCEQKPCHSFSVTKSIIVQKIIGLRFGAQRFESFSIQGL